MKSSKRSEDHPADIICFQEVFIPDEDTQHDLAEAFGPDATWIHENISYFVEEGYQGNAILSRYPIKRSKYFDLTVGSHEKRGLLLADIEIPGKDGNKTLVHVGCLHLGLIETERQTQLRKLEKAISEAIYDKHPFILAGDFNDWRRRIWMEPFLKTKMFEAFRELNGHYALSFPSYMPMLPLDRIYFSRLALMGCERFKGKPWRHISDHLPLMAEFKCPD